MSGIHLNSITQRLDIRFAFSFKIANCLPVSIAFRPEFRFRRLNCLLPTQVASWYQLQSLSILLSTIPTLVKLTSNSPSSLPTNMCTLICFTLMPTYHHIENIALKLSFVQ